MDNLSAFQLLPYHVVKLIVDHVSGSSRLQFDRNSAHPNEYDKLQVPLLRVCHNFRTLVHQRFCKALKLTLKNDSEIVKATLYSWPLLGNKPSYPTHHLAKELWLVFDVESVYSGKALQMLSAAPYEGCAFPLVRKIIFKLTSDLDYCYDSELKSDDDDDNDNNDSESESDGSNASMDKHTYPRDITANITAFAQRIKKMAPALSKIDVATSEDVDYLFMDNYRHIFHLAEDIFGIVEKHTVFTNGIADLVSHLNLEPIRDLVRINYFMDTNYAKMILLIRRSAQTLQFLAIDVSNINVSGCLSDPDDGGYLEFPTMHTLKISTSNIEPSNKAVFKDFVPFPRLQRLTATSAYPFGDDVVFRGNADTLEFLELELPLETVSMLREYKVFTPT
ncbi:hypothetical protein GGI24_002499, partial [Coemansia furcata]